MKRVLFASKIISAMLLAVSLVSQSSIVVFAKVRSGHPGIDPELKHSLKRWSREPNDSHHVWVDIEVSARDDELCAQLIKRDANIYEGNSHLAIYLPARRVASLRAIKQIEQIRVHDPKRPFVIAQGHGRGFCNCGRPTLPPGSPVPDNE